MRGKLLAAVEFGAFRRRQAYRDALRITDVEGPEWAKDTRAAQDKAGAYLYALKKPQEAVATFHAEIAFSHPEWLEDLNQKLRERRGEEDPPRTRSRTPQPAER